MTRSRHEEDKLWRFPQRKYSNDCFRLLPLELRVEIACYLPMADFVELRCSSRAMAVVSTVQGFWKTRFSSTADRGYLRHLTEDTNANIDWRRLYHLTAHCEHLGRRCQSRQNRWLKYEWIKDRYSMTHGFKEIPAPHNWGVQSPRGDDGYMLSNYSASLKGKKNQNFKLEERSGHFSM